MKVALPEQLVFERACSHLLEEVHGAPCIDSWSTENTKPRSLFSEQVAVNIFGRGSRTDYPIDRQSGAVGPAVPHIVLGLQESPEGLHPLYNAQ